MKQLTLWDLPLQSTGAGGPAAAQAPAAKIIASDPVEPAQLDALLAQVIAQARALGIPVSGRIDPHVRLNARAKKRFGCCIGSVKSGFVIELAAALPAAGRQTCLQTLAHEVLHTCTGCGKSFLRQKTSPLIRQPARYRCAACGGKLRVEKLG